MYLMIPTRTGGSSSVTTTAVHTRLTGDEVEQRRGRQPAVSERLRRVQDTTPDHVVHDEERRHETSVVLASRAPPKYPCVDTTTTIIIVIMEYFTRLFVELSPVTIFRPPRRRASLPVATGSAKASQHHQP